MEHFAMAITAFGGPQVLQHQSITPRAPQAGQIAVKVAACGVNPIDWKTRAGLGWAAKANAENLPWVPGYDVSGYVAALGEGVDDFAVGDPVVGLVGFATQGGGYASYVVVDAVSFVALDPSLDLPTAAGLPIPALTASQAISRLDFSVTPHCVVLGAGGAAGSLAVQWALRQGASHVTALVRHREQYVDDPRLDAESVTIVSLDDWQAPDYALCAIDAIGGVVAQAWVKTLAPGSRVVTLPTVTAEAVAEANRKVDTQGMLMQADREALREWVQHWAQGSIAVSAPQRRLLAEAASAHADIESGALRGKVVLLPQEG